MSRIRPATAEPPWILDGPRITLLWIRIDGLVTDMPESLSERFAAAQSNVIDVDGESVVATYEVETLDGFVMLTLERAVPEPVQGLRLRARDMLLEVNHQVSSDLVTGGIAHRPLCGFGYWSAVRRRPCDYGTSGAVGWAQRRRGLGTQACASTELVMVCGSGVAMARV